MSTNEQNIQDQIAKNNSAFQIDDAYTLKRDGKDVTYVSGFLLKGTFKQGEGICMYSGEQLQLTCRILSLEKIGRDDLKEITYAENGGNENAYGIIVDNPNVSLFKKGNIICSLDNGHNKINKDKLSDSRLGELRAMLDSDITQEKADALSIQELSFLIKCIRNEKIKDENKADLLKKTIISKINNADELFITIDLNTNTPFLNNGTVDVYSLKSYADDAVDYYGKQFRKLSVRQMNNKTDQLPLFVYLALLGVKSVTIDNGQQHIQLDVNDFISEKQLAESILQKSDEHPDFFNPEFRYAMNICLSELRWPVDYPNRNENCEVKDKAMWSAFKNSKLLVPIKQVVEEVNGEKIRAVPDGNISIPHVNNGNGDTLIAIFTDLDEFQKMYPVDEWGVILVDGEKTLSLDDSVGLVINPLTENLVITKERLPQYRENILNGLSPNAVNKNNQKK
ncbi:MAG: SseB family protein [Lachnospiraceae bacterium]|nr:SseB family protein [Lachnospiraceae bacterium]MDY2956823.1 SseB family protein [Lachnospiraceae bacterium]